jgi:hypothetical protein
MACSGIAFLDGWMIVSDGFVKKNVIIKVFEALMKSTDNANLLSFF